MKLKNKVLKQKNWILDGICFQCTKEKCSDHNWQDGDDKTPFFVKYSYIWHYTGFGIEDRTKLMRLTWETYGANYTNYEEIKEGMLKGKTYDDIKGAG